MKALGLAMLGALALAVPSTGLADPHGHDQGGGPPGHYGGGPPGHYGGAPPGHYGGGPPGRYGGGPPGHYGGAPPPGRYGGPPRGYGAPPRGYGGPAPGYRRGGPPDEEGWDERRFNGYWLGNRWFYGPPPGGAEDEPSFRPGYAPWRRGAFLPPYYDNQVVEDYWAFHLRRPPYGYHWIEVGHEFLLVSDDTGLIFDIVPGE